MRIRFIQQYIDFIRLKYFKSYFKKCLNNNPIFLKTIMNLLSLFPNSENKLKCKLLRFLGAKIGNNVSIGRNVYVYKPKNLELDDYVAIADNTVMRCWNKIRIGKYTFLAINSVFVPGSHNTYDYENLENQDIFIGKGCWIGANVTILGGAKIMNGCIIGAGTVLCSGEYSPFSIIVGVPGRIIKKRNPSKIIKLPVEYDVEELVDG